MSPEQIAEARKLAAEAKARADRATPGTWKAAPAGYRGDTVSGYIDTCALVVITSPGCAYEIEDVEEDDAVFIAAARSDVPALSDHVTALADEVERLRHYVIETEDGAFVDVTAQILRDDASTSIDTEVADLERSGARDGEPVSEVLP